MEPCLWTTSPGHQWEGFYPDGLWDDEDGDALLVSNDLVTFTFRRSHAGLSLTAWRRNGGVSWENNERQLWAATVYDVDLGKELGVLAIGPDVGAIEWVEETADGLAASWLVDLSGDRLRVRLDFSLVGDTLFTDCRAEWVGAVSRWAVDSIFVLPLMTDYRDVGDDFAVQAAVRGMQVKDPRYRFRYIPQDPDQPIFGWLERHRNFTATCSGKSQSMPIWGYYSSLSREGWMIWADDRADETMMGTFQSEGLYLGWDYALPQPGWLEAGNGGHALETNTRLALRPFLADTKEAWWDMAEHYRQRLEANRPEWFTPKIALDPSREDIERRPAVWVDFDVDAFDIANTGAAIGGEIEGVVAHLREQLQVGTEVPFFGFVVGTPERSRPHMPGNPPGDENTERSGVAQAHGSVSAGLRNCYFGLHKPANHWPGPTGVGTWGDGTTNFWEQWDGPQMYVRQRLAQILGESPLRLGNNGTRDDDFYRSQSNTVAGWNAGLVRVELADPIDAFGKFFQWGGTGIRIEDPTHGPLQGEVTQIQSSVFAWIRSPGLRDAAGRIREPTVGAAVTMADLEDDLCHHAVLGSEVKEFLERYLVKAQRDGWRQGILYLDVYPARALRNKNLCSGDHTGWSRILPGYVNHPRGGGSWWNRSLRDYYRALWEAGRCEQSPGVMWIGSEYLDESHFPYNAICLHVAGYSRLWRTYEPSPNNPSFVSQANHGIHPVPMFHVVHAGRGYCLQRAFNMGNGALSVITRNDSVFPAEAPKYRAAFGLWMCGEWVWGMTPPQYLHTANDNLGVTLATADLWDPDQYVGGNAADSSIAALRDLWVSLVRAELQWATSYLRNGDLLAPGDDEGSDTFDVHALGVFDEAFGSDALSRRNDLPTLWPSATYPRAVHAAWASTTGASVCVFFLNWTDTSGTADWSFPFERYGLAGEVVVFTVTAAGVATRVGSFWDTYRYTQSVPAHTMQALLLVPEPETESVQIRSDVVRSLRGSTVIDYYRPVVTLEVELRQSGQPLNLSGATTRQISALLPNGSAISVSGTLVTDGTDGRMRLDLAGALFRSNPGVWKIWGQALIGGQDFVGSKSHLVARVP